MKRISAPSAVVVCCVLALLFVGHAQGRQVSSTDKDKALQLLESSKKDVLDATQPDRWSIAECMEHIAAAEDYIRGMIIEKVVVAPPASDRDIAKIDAGIIVNETLTSQRTDATKNNRRVASVRRPADAVSVDGFWAQLLATPTKEQVHD